MGWFETLGPQSQAALVAALVGAVFGLIGGIIGPIVQGQVRQTADVAQLRMQADLARQAKLIDAQDTFLTDMTRALWKWRYASIGVAYYGRSDREDMYDNAWKEYDLNIWALLNDIRVIISRSRRLVSDDTFRDLQKFYVLGVDLDRSISSAAADDDPTRRISTFAALNERIYVEVSDTIDSLILKVGSDFGLTGRSVPS